MKKLLLLGAAMLLFIACEEKEVRYTQNSDEIETFKSAMANYESGDWDGYMSHYADTAKIYINSSEAISPQQNAENFKESTQGYTKYGFLKDKGDIEMVVTDEGETWVNYWGVWEGTFADNNKTFTVPLHLTAQFVDGKIVKEYGYWDSAEIAMDRMEMQKKAMEVENDSTDME